MRSQPGILNMMSILLVGVSANTQNFMLSKESLGGSIIKIVGGEQADPGQFPYQVGMYIQMDLKKVFCGGSLISPNYVLTAAHCTEGALSIDVILGAYNITEDTESTRQRQTSSNYTTHPGWDSTNLVNDLALVYLSTPVELNDNVKTITLASGNASFDKQDGTTSGWGLTSDEQTTVTEILRYETNLILSNTECKSVDTDYDAVIQTTHVCLSGEGDKSVCNGDSGGPLVSNGIQVGITSFNFKSCNVGKPSVFTRVSEFTEWIQNNSDVVIV